MDRRPGCLVLGGSPRSSALLAVHRNGSKAHADGPDISADFAARQLASFLPDVATRWIRRPLAAPSASAV